MEVLFRDTKITFREAFTWKHPTSQEVVSCRKISSFYRITYIWNGCCLLHCLNADGGVDRSFELQKGDFCYIPPGLWYYTESTKGMENTNLYFYYTTASTPPEAIPSPDRLALQQGTQELPPLCPVFQFKDTPVLSDIFSLHDTFSGADLVWQMRKEWDTRYLYSSELLDNMMAGLLLRILRENTFQSRPRSRIAADRTITYVAEHYQEKLDCRTIAKALGYHPNYLNTVIRNATGMGLYDYIIDTKIRHAVDLVTHTDLQISEIAAMLSFSDISHFSHVYKARVGISPTKQRKKDSSAL